MFIGVSPMRNQLPTSFSDTDTPLPRRYLVHSDIKKIKQKFVYLIPSSPADHHWKCRLPLWCHRQYQRLKLLFSTKIHWNTRCVSRFTRHQCLQLVLLKTTLARFWFPSGSIMKRYISRYSLCVPLTVGPTILKFWAKSGSRWVFLH